MITWTLRERHESNSLRHLTCGKSEGPILKIAWVTSELASWNRIEVWTQMLDTSAISKRRAYKEFLLPHTNLRKMSLTTFAGERWAVSRKHSLKTNGEWS